MKQKSIIALLLALCVLSAGCAAQAEKKINKGTEGNTSVSVSADSTTTDSSPTGETTEKSNTANNQSSTLPYAENNEDFEAGIVTLDEGDVNTVTNNNETTTSKDDGDSTTAKSYETPILPIP